MQDVEFLPIENDFWSEKSLYLVSYFSKKFIVANFFLLLYIYKLCKKCFKKTTFIIAPCNYLEFYFNTISYNL